MEFLLTYGWALLVVITGLGVWGFYFDFYPIKSGSLTPQTCMMDIGLSCLDHRLYLYDDGFDRYNELQLSVKNNIGNRIRVTQISFPAYGRDFAVNVLLENGERNDLSAFTVEDVTNGYENPSAGTLPIGTKYDIAMIVTVENLDSGLTHTFNGRITGTIT